MFFKIIILLNLFKIIFGIKSEVNFNYDIYKETGNSFITLKNVCLKEEMLYGKARIMLYNLSSKEIDEFKYFSNKLSIQYTFFYEINDEIPNYAYWWKSEKGVWINSCFCSTLWHYFDYYLLYDICNKEKYPPVNEVIFLQLNGGIGEMQFFLTQLFTYHYKNITKYYFEDLLKIFRYKYICFKEINVVNRRVFGHYGMIFKTKEERRIFRDDAYQYLNINEKKLDTIEIGIIYRKIENGQRKIINEENIIKLIKEMNLKYNYKINRIYFDGLDVKEQIKLILNKNLIISPSGSSLCNIIWFIHSYNVIIECFGLYINNDINHSSTSFGINYFPLFSKRTLININEYYDSYNISKSEYPSVHVNTVSFHPLRKDTNGIMEISLKQILSVLYYSIKYIKRNKFN